MSLIITNDVLHPLLLMRIFPQLSSEVKLLRLLLRTDCDEVRKTLMRERLRMPHQDIFSASGFRNRANGGVDSVSAYLRA